MSRSRFNDALEKLARAEQQFLAREFLAPAIGQGEVQVRIAGAVNRMRVSPVDFRGFGVFQPKSHREAELVRSATLAQRRAYLALFPRVRLILTIRDRAGQWLAVTAHQGDHRFRLAGLAPVQMVEEAQQFNVIRARFDGRAFWFEGVEPARDPAIAAYLRQQVAKGTDARQLDRPGLTPEERLAYAINVAPAEPQLLADDVGDAAGSRLRAALAQAGAELVDYLERDDSFRVTYRVGGEQHVSAVRKDDLSVQVAGICLSGEDQQFDLTSLVGVLREAAGDVARVGDDGMPEDHYWRVHPPQNG
jgi:hypothetical protein